MTTFGDTFPYVLDLTSNCNHATAYNCEAADVSTDIPTGGGASGRSYDFGGTDERVFAPHSSVYDFERTDAFSVVCWFKATLSAESCLVSKSDANGWYVSVTAAGNLVFLAAHTAATRIVVQSSTSGFDNGSWRHVVVTYSGNGLASGVTLNVDGTPRAKTTVQDNLGANTIRNTHRVGIGALDPTDLEIAGKVDEVGIYNTALSGADVTTLYNSGSVVDLRTTGPTANLVGYWRMGDLITHRRR